MTLRMPNLSKSSTVPSSGASGRRPEIGKPVLQRATPSAASLISKAAGTGVSQMSILSSGDKDKKSSRAVGFCDPLTLPSPTSPNTPPIIHQPASNAFSPSTSPPPTLSSLTTVTPYWSKVESPKSAFQVCRIEENAKAPIALPESTKIKDSISDKIKMKLSSAKQPKSEEKHSLYRGLQISNPVLRSDVDLKMDLIPICTNSVSSAEIISPLHRISSETSDNLAVSPLKSSKPVRTRPLSSIGGGSRPVRPSIPPPPRPTTLYRKDENSNQSSDEEGCPLGLNLDRNKEETEDTLSICSSNEGDLLREIILEADRKIESETGETEAFSSIMRRHRKLKKTTS